MKNIYKKVLIIVMAGILLIPFMKVNYYNGTNTEIRKYSIVSSLIEDVKEESFMTLELLLNR